MSQKRGGGEGGGIFFFWFLVFLFDFPSRLFIMLTYQVLKVFKLEKFQTKVTQQNAQRQNLTHDLD